MCKCKQVITYIFGGGGGGVVVVFGAVVATDYSLITRRAILFFGASTEKVVPTNMYKSTLPNG